MFRKCIYQTCLLHAVVNFSCLFPFLSLSIQSHTNMSHTSTCVDQIMKMALVCKSLPKTNRICSCKTIEGSFNVQISLRLETLAYLKKKTSYCWWPLITSHGVPACPWKIRPKSPWLILINVHLVSSLYL